VLKVGEPLTVSYTNFRRLTRKNTRTLRILGSLQVFRRIVEDPE
jgi:hypothetical protein